MERHQTTGRVGMGFGLACTTMLLWGALPIALKVILAEMAPSTITFYRFLGSAFVVGAVLGVRGRLPSLRTLDRPVRWMLLAAGTFLCVDYLLYLMSLDRTTPADAQVLIQLGPLLLAMGGLLFFREKFGLGQWVGFATLLAGLGVFFRSQLGAVAADLAGHDQYLVGNLLMVGAATFWAFYGLVQKQLLRSLASEQIMFCIYVGCAVLFFPLSAPVRPTPIEFTGERRPHPSRQRSRRAGGTWSG
ncbi:MAG: EamA family transporter [Candidatus Binatia bacterium]|nr:EamA family transporter [Candidatus Binatia bacterium]